MPRDPIHPGQFLADELAELSMTPAELARELHGFRVLPKGLSAV